MREAEAWWGAGPAVRVTHQGRGTHLGFVPRRGEVVRERFLRLRGVHTDQGPAGGFREAGARPVVGQHHRGTGLDRDEGEPFDGLVHAEVGQHSPGTPYRRGGHSGVVPAVAHQDDVPALPDTGGDEFRGQHAGPAVESGVGEGRRRR
ncbi:hypothetical protein LUR56_16590 [Streptomyces sp. MT29]|nr:hypothetical protein [Streptomyces sp. MT29]